MEEDMSWLLWCGIPVFFIFCFILARSIEESAAARRRAIAEEEVFNDIMENGTENEKIIALLKKQNEQSGKLGASIATWWLLKK